MTQRTLRFIGLDAASIVYADPLDPNATFRVKHSLQARTYAPGFAGSVVNNELISVRPTVVVQPGTTLTGTETISVRTKISNGSLNSVAGQAALRDHIENLQRAMAVGLTQGFLPLFNTEFVIDHSSSELP